MKIQLKSLDSSAEERLEEKLEMEEKHNEISPQMKKVWDEFSNSIPQVKIAIVTEIDGRKLALKNELYTSYASILGPEGKNAKFAKLYAKFAKLAEEYSSKFDKLIEEILLEHIKQNLNNIRNTLMEQKSKEEDIKNQKSRTFLLTENESDKAEIARLNKKLDEKSSAIDSNELTKLEGRAKELFSQAVVRSAAIADHNRENTKSYTVSLTILETIKKYEDHISFEAYAKLQKESQELEKMITREKDLDISVNENINNESNPEKTNTYEIRSILEKIKKLPNKLKEEIILSAKKAKAETDYVKLEEHLRTAFLTLKELLKDSSAPLELINVAKEAIDEAVASYSEKLANTIKCLIQEYKSSEIQAFRQLAIKISEALESKYDPELIKSRFELVTLSNNAISTIRDLKPDSIKKFNQVVYDVTLLTCALSSIKLYRDTNMCQGEPFTFNTEHNTMHLEHSLFQIDTRYKMNRKFAEQIGKAEKTIEKEPSLTEIEQSILLTKEIKELEERTILLQQRTLKEDIILSAEKSQEEEDYKNSGKYLVKAFEALDQLKKSSAPSQLIKTAQEAIDDAAADYLEQLINISEELIKEYNQELAELTTLRDSTIAIHKKIPKDRNPESIKSILTEISTVRDQYQARSKKIEQLVNDIKDLQATLISAQGQRIAGYSNKNVWTDRSFKIVSRPDMAPKLTQRMTAARDTILSQRLQQSLEKHSPLIKEIQALDKEIPGQQRNSSELISSSPTLTASSGPQMFKEQKISICQSPGDLKRIFGESKIEVYLGGQVQTDQKGVVLKQAEPLARVHIVAPKGVPDEVLKRIITYLTTKGYVFFDFKGCAIPKNADWSTIIQTNNKIYPEGCHFLRMNYRAGKILEGGKETSCKSGWKSDKDSSLSLAKELGQESIDLGKYQKSAPTPTLVPGAHS